MKGLNNKVLDFYPDQNAIPLGDVVLANETVLKECKAQDKPVEDHTIHLVVHGTLHLLGYDHMMNGEAKSMEKLECEILDVLGYPDPYADKKPAKKAVKKAVKKPAKKTAKKTAKKSTQKPTKKLTGRRS